MPDVHLVDARRDAKVLDARIVGRRWIEHVVQIGSRQVCVCGGVEMREEEGGERGREGRSR